jgi:hypothetical protein
LKCQYKAELSPALVYTALIKAVLRGDGTGEAYATFGVKIGLMISQNQKHGIRMD